MDQLIPFTVLTERKRVGSTHDEQYNLAAIDRYGAVWIIDNCYPEYKSVTNDAVRIVRELHNMHPDCRIIYRDSMGNWDELLHERGRFVGYKVFSRIRVQL